MKVTDASRPQSHSEEPAKACQKTFVSEFKGMILREKVGRLKYAPPVPSPLPRPEQAGLLKCPFFCVYSAAFMYLAQVSKKKGILERKSYIDWRITSLHCVNFTL